MIRHVRGRFRPAVSSVKTLNEHFLNVKSMYIYNSEMQLIVTIFVIVIHSGTSPWIVHENAFTVCVHLAWRLVR